MTRPKAAPRFLASVTSPDEALIARAGGADIIDAKNPAAGALGALSPATVAHIRACLPQYVTLSATIGDLACEPATIAAAVGRMAGSGCDLIKIGFFPGGDAHAAIAAVGRLALGKTRLVGLLLADLEPDFDLIPCMAEAGFAGVMVDTAGKVSGSLTQHLTPAQLRHFLDAAAKSNLFAGIAGSLRVSDVPSLVPLMPDVLGFRGALCRSGDRTGPIDLTCVRHVRQALDRAAAALEGNSAAVRATA